MKRLAPIVLVLALAAAACGDDSSGGGTTPSSTVTKDSFNGTVQPGGSDFHNFTVAQNSQVDVTLTVAGPPDTIVMGVAVGTLSGSTCLPLAGGSVTTPSGSTPQLSGGVSPGTFCVVVYDVGNQTGSINYTVTVSHQ